MRKVFRTGLAAIFAAGFCALSIPPHGTVTVFVGGVLGAIASLVMQHYGTLEPDRESYTGRALIVNVCVIVVLWGSAFLSTQVELVRYAFDAVISDVFAWGAVGFLFRAIVGRTVADGQS